MEKIRSKDGTPIVYERSGSGAPLVLVHGTTGTHARWNALLPAFIRQFTVYTVDRRGWGASGTASNYDFQSSVDDIAAVSNSVGEGVNLLGHSFGAICALEASLLTPHLHTLVLYEPPLPTPGVQFYPQGLIDRIQALVDAGDRAGALITFMREIAKIPDHEIEVIRTMPIFPARVAGVETLLRELRAHEAYRFEPERFRHMNVPTFFLLGSDSPPLYKAAVEAGNAALPNSRIVVLPGQQHIAMDTAPDLFVSEVLTFLAEAGVHQQA